VSFGTFKINPNVDETDRAARCVTSRQRLGHGSDLQSMPVNCQDILYMTACGFAVCCALVNLQLCFYYCDETICHAVKIVNSRFKIYLK
jgi:hypothetical protein